jgi:hypothetical protein
MKPKQANPQGKGLATISGFLMSLNEAAVIRAKNIQQISDDLFTSLFILHSSFKFKPVKGKSYWLYQSERKFQLSLISPQEWQDRSFGKPIGCCQLHSDMTWTLELTEEALADGDFMAMIGKRKAAFEKNLQQASKLIDILPGYQQHLPYYQRAFSGALAHSLKVSMIKSGISMLSHQTAKDLISSTVAS